MSVDSKGKFSSAPDLLTLSDCMVGIPEMKVEVVGRFVAPGMLMSSRRHQEQLHNICDGL